MYVPSDFYFIPILNPKVGLRSNFLPGLARNVLTFVKATHLHFLFDTPN